MNNTFAAKIAPLIKKYAPKYGINVYSPIIAQAVLESGNGTSELAVNANNFFGLKYKPGRCPTASGVYKKVGTEQNKDGLYSSSQMNWCMFKSMEDCVIGYFDFISHSRYKKLKGVTDPETYLILIKAAGYATSLDYVKNVMDKITKYNLTKYDNLKEEEDTMLIAIDAGHGLKTAGKRCDIALDPKQTREWVLNDRIADRLEALLKNYNCTTMRVDDTTGDKDVALATRTNLANAKKADVYISIHHNAGVNRGTGGGVVVYYYSSKAERKTQAQALYNAVIAQNGLVGNRSSKVIKKNYYVLAHTDMPAFLIENGFMDSQTDVPIILSTAHAEKTARGILNFLVKEYSLKTKTVTSTTTATKKTYKVQCGAFSNKKNAETLKTKLTKAGYTAIIVNDAVNGKSLYRVQCGAFSVKKNAEALKKQLTTAGFQAIIV